MAVQTRGRFWRANAQRQAVLRLGIPAVAEQLLALLVSLVDTYVVGHLGLAVLQRLGYTSEVALAAVGMAGQFTWTLTTLFMAVALGCTVVVARFVGGGDWDMANKALRQSLLIGALLGVLGLSLAWLLAPQMISLLGGTAEVQRYAVQYFRIAMLAFPLQALLYIGNAALRGAGDMRAPLLVMGVVNGINVVLSLALVNGFAGMPGMGIAGAAWGTAIGQGCGGLLVLFWLLRGRAGLLVNRLPRPDWALMWRILRMGLPYGAEQFVFQAALLLFVQMITSISTVAYAAHTTVVTVESISFLPGMGIAVAATTLVGQHMGAGDAQSARASGFEAFRLAALFMALIGACFVLVPQLFVGFFVQNDPAVVAAATVPLRLVGFAQPALAANFVFSGALRGGGDARWPLYTKIISVWCVRLPLAWLLVFGLGWGLNGIWVAMSTDFAVQGLLVWWRFRLGRWVALSV